MSIQLPDPIDRYVRIANAGTADAAPDCFAPDAIVRDEGHVHAGVAAIKNWMAATRQKYGHTIAPLELTSRDGQSVLRARITGSFPGSPITVNFGFVLDGGKIRALEIRS